MAKNELLVTREQQAVFESMSTALRSQAKRGYAIRRGITTTDVLGRYDLGVIVTESISDEAKYGERAVASLAEFWGEDPNALWQYRQFAGAYSREQVEALLDKASTANYRLTWSHFDALSSVSGTRAVSTRRSLEKQCFQEKLTSHELRAKVQEQAGGPQSSGGRPVSKPRSILAGIGEMNKVAKQYHKRTEGWREVVFAGLAEAGPDQVTADLLLKMQEGLETQKQLLADTADSVQNYEDAVARINEILAANASDAETAESDAVAGDYDYAADANEEAVAETEEAVEESTESVESSEEEVAEPATRPAARRKKKSGKKPPKKAGKPNNAEPSAAAERVAAARKRRSPVPT